MICNMDAKKEKVRGIRFEAELWETIKREAKQEHRTPAAHVRHLLEQILTNKGLLRKGGSGRA